MTEISTSVREVLQEHSRLGSAIGELTDEDDLYQAGMTSHASVEVMLALEETFDVEFPDHMLRREVFESIAAITEAVTELRGE